MTLTTNPTPPASTPPHGRIAIVFTDVEGSTAAWERFGSHFGAALQIHERYVVEVAARHGGHIAKTTGDGFMLAFADPAAAAAFAVEVQDRLAAPCDVPAWTAVGGVRIRVGIHVGEPALREGDYFGPPVNRTARVCDAAAGGMVLLTEDAAEAVRDGLSPGVTLHDRGLQRLKDLGEPARLFELRKLDSHHSAFRPLRTLEARQHNFPLQVTSLVGRTAELGELNRLLAAGGPRLITLTGPGGTGKTRLALQVAADRVLDYLDGVWLVELAATSDAKAVPADIALALGLELAAGADAELQVTRFLRSRRCLVVLDNFEQVSTAAPFVATLLRECGDLRFIVTSRELLHLRGEREFMVEPLNVPPAEGSTHHWERYDSVQLFVERAHAARADFVLTKDIAPTIGAICRRLDGIPLAIELAAARVRGMSSAQILQRLSRRFDLLSSTQRDLPERQRTLRNAVDWSYDLLNQDERRLFEQLAVFSDGCTLDAAEAVCTGDDVLDTIFSLRDKSLLKTREARGETRYSMFDTIREYARERLDSSEDVVELSRRHATYYLHAAEAWNDAVALSGPQSADAMRAFADDLSNVRGGMDWSLANNNPQIAIAYAKALFAFLRRRGLYDECDDRLSRAEAAARSAGDPSSLARLLNQRGLAALEQSHPDRAKSLFEESCTLCRDLGERDRVLVALVNLGNVAWMSSRFMEARTSWLEALELAVELGQVRYEAWIRENLAILDCQEGRYDEAAGQFEASLEMHRRTNNLAGEASCLYNSSELFRRRGDLDTALDRVRSSHALYTDLESRYGLALANVRIAMVLLERGRTDEASEPAAEGLRIAEETHSGHGIMYALDVLARIRLREGRLADARQLLRGSVQRAKDAGDARHLADAAWHCAELIAAEGRSDSADKLRLLACRECSRLGLMPPAEWAALAPPASDGGAGSREALTSVLDAELAER